MSGGALNSKGAVTFTGETEISNGTLDVKGNVYFKKNSTINNSKLVVSDGEQNSEIALRVQGKLTVTGDSTIEADMVVLEAEGATIEFKLSDDLAEFVTGNSAEEMRGRAEKLAHNTVSKTVDVQKVEKPEPKKSDMAELADKLFGSNQSN